LLSEFCQASLGLQLNQPKARALAEIGQDKQQRCRYAEIMQPAEHRRSSFGALSTTHQTRTTHAHSYLQKYLLKETWMELKFVALWRGMRFTDVACICGASRTMLSLPTHTQEAHFQLSAYF